MTDPGQPAVPTGAMASTDTPPAAGHVQVNAPSGGGVVNAVQGGVLNVYQWKPAYRIEEFPAVPRPIRSAKVRAQPSLLLRAGYRVVPFTGRQVDLGKLTDWRDDDNMPGLGVRLLHGPGGQGKTRLADRFAEVSRADGWAVWRATTDPQGAPALRTTSGIDQLGNGLLVVVDYAERWPVPALNELLQERMLHMGRALSTTPQNWIRHTFRDRTR